MTCSVCQSEALGRRFVGCELKDEYAEMARQRIEHGRLVDSSSDTSTEAQASLFEVADA